MSSQIFFHLQGVKNIFTFYLFEMAFSDQTLFNYDFREIELNSIYIAPSSTLIQNLMQIGKYVRPKSSDW